MTNTERLAEALVRRAAIAAREYLLGYCCSRLTGEDFDRLRSIEGTERLVSAVLDGDGVRAALAAHEAAAQTEPHDTRGPTTLEGWRSAALAGEKEREWLRERLKTVDRHQGKDCWYWQHDGEDHLESMTNALPVVIRAGHLRELLAAKAEPAGEAVPVLYVGLIERLMRLSTRLGIAHSDSVEHFAASLEDRLYAICRSAESLLDSLATPPAVPAPEAKAVPVHGSQP